MVIIIFQFRIFIELAIIMQRYDNNHWTDTLLILLFRKIQMFSSSDILFKIYVVVLYFKHYLIKNLIIL